MTRLAFSTTLLLTFFLWIPSVLAKRSMPVFVSIIPQRYLVEKIGQHLVKVRVMVPPGADAHTYEPKPRQMVAISETKVYFTVGIEFERRWLKKIASANREMKVVHTDHGIEKIPMEAEHHYDGGEHGHDSDEYGRLDPHIWLSPPLVIMQARNILSALQDIDPAHRSEYEANYNVFVAQVRDLDGELRELFRGQDGLQFMVFHPAWGYFARTYNLRQVPVEIEGKALKPGRLVKIIELAKARGIKVLFVQPRFSFRSADLIAKEIGGQVAFVDPLALDWSTNLREVAGKFKAALK